MEAFDEEIESVLYVCREVSVYKIPPLRVNEGHRANDWGDLAKPLWKGRLRIMEKGNTVHIKFEDPNSGDLFAQTLYDPDKPSIEAVLDSSRYFVVRVEDSGKKAYIGMGFAERTDSFDFNVTLQDYTKRYYARLNPATEAEEDKSTTPAGPKKDYSLKEGQTFSIAIPGRQKAEGVQNILGSSSSSSGSTGNAVPLLPPPPPSAPRKRN